MDKIKQAEEAGEEQSKDYYEPTTEEKTLVAEYEKGQRIAQEKAEATRVAELENPHTLRSEIVKNPSTKGTYALRIGGKKIDLAMLEKYLLHKISPKSSVNMLKYSDGTHFEKYLNIPVRRKKKSRPWLFLLFMIIGILLIFIVAMYMASSDFQIWFQQMLGSS